LWRKVTSSSRERVCWGGGKKRKTPADFNKGEGKGKEKVGTRKYGTGKERTPSLNKQKNQGKRKEAE